MRRAEAGISLLELLCVLAVSAVLVMSVWRLVPSAIRSVRVMQANHMLRQLAEQGYAWLADHPARHVTSLDNMIPILAQAHYLSASFTQQTASPWRKPLSLYLITDAQAVQRWRVVLSGLPAKDCKQLQRQWQEVLTQMQCVPQPNQQFEFSGVV
jgi:type II secretory pathway component PulJ